MRLAGIVLAILWSGAGSVAVAGASPLREIGHTAITEDICANVVVHANSAIAAALRGDERLARALVRLRGNELDDDRPSKRAAIAELAGIANSVDESSLRGRDEIKRLSAIAERGEHVRARDLVAFLRPLDSVLERQGKLATSLAAFLGGLDVRDLRVGGGNPSAATDQVGNGRQVALGGFGVPRPWPTGRSNLPVALGRTMADELERSMSANVADETAASERAEAAVTGC